MQTNAFPSPATIDGYQRISGACSESEHVHLRTGNLMCRYSVVDVPTVGVPLRMTLFYNHQDALSDVMGTNWRHDYMTRLLFSGVPATQVTLVSETGRQYGFVLSGTDWVPDGTSFFLSGTLTHPGGTPDWRLTRPDGSWKGFDPSGRLVCLVDAHGNTTTLTWSHETSLYDTARYDMDSCDSVLLAITEPRGRQITLGYSGGFLTTITDPRNGVTLLGYTGTDLTSITGPEGCVTRFGWDGATPNRISSRTDARNNVHAFFYHDDGQGDGTNRLRRVEDPEGNSISYTHGTYQEHTADTGFELFERTILTDARSHTWTYEFDLSGNLWRLINPLGHTKRFRWDPQQNLIFRSEPFQYGSTNDGPGDNYNNAFHRQGWDEKGNLLYSADASGIVSAYTYDNHGNMLTASQGQANLAVQGNWIGQYGSEGHVLCAFDPGTPPTDRQSLPSYVSAIHPGTAAFARLNANATVPLNLMDPRAPRGSGQPAAVPGLLEAVLRYVLRIRGRPHRGALVQPVRVLPQRRHGHLAHESPAVPRAVRPRPRDHGHRSRRHAIVPCREQCPGRLGHLHGPRRRQHSGRRHRRCSRVLHHRRMRLRHHVRPAGEPSHPHGIQCHQ